MKLRVLIPLVLLIHSPSLLGEEAKWKGELELGVVLTSGNTEEENVNSRGDFTRESEKWRQNYHFDTLRSSQEDELTAQKLYVFYKADYKYKDNRFFFTRVSYEDDRFSGFDYHVDLTLGYGLRLIDREDIKLEADIGPGVRRSKLDTGEVETESILRLAAACEWTISEHAVFTQSVSSEIGPDSTITRSVTALRSTINHRFAMKLAYSVKHNSEVPVGASKTDTETSVTLVYSF